MLEDKIVTAFESILQKLSISNSSKAYILEEIKIYKQNAYTSLNYLFYPLFFNKPNDIDEEILIKLCSAGYLYYRSLQTSDDIVDLKLTGNIGESIVNIQVLQEESIKLLCEIFSNKKEFWDYWNNRRKEFLIAMEMEKHDKLINSISVFCKFADYKSAFGKSAIDALYLLSGKKKSEQYHQLLKSHEFFSATLQILDDIQDFKEDMETGQFNYAIFLLKQKKPDYKKFAYQELKAFFYISGIAIELLNIAIELAQKAILIADELNMQNWKILILTMQNKAKYQKNTVVEHFEIQKATKLLKQQIPDSLKQSVLKSIFLSDENEHLSTSIFNSLKYILNQWIIGFPEAQHIMYLGASDDFKNDTDIHITDIFQRAIITDLLIDMDKVLKFDLKEVIELEISYLVSKRKNDDVGGWSYFQTVNEIAADIDDLGQIMQVFIKNDRLDLIEQYCTKALDISLSDNICKTGGIKTWIVPENPIGDIQKIQQNFNRSKWGEGPDVEVTANFLYALFLLDKQKYNKVIIHGISYILKNQNDNGSWSSRWYYGDYYGGYVISKLLSNYKDLINVRESTEKLMSFITNSQIKNGSWGIKQKSGDALSTSLALLTFIQLGFDNKSQVIMNGEKFLFNSLLSDGSFEAVDFIKPKLGYPYKSKTLTTIYALLAFIKIHN